MMAPVERNNIRQQVYQYIRTYIQENNISPSIREIATACHLAPSTAAYCLQWLEGKGMILRDPNKMRSIRLPKYPPR